MILVSKGPRGLRRVTAAGGPVTALVAGAAADPNYGPARYPQFLPDGRRFLFLARGKSDGENRIYLSDLDGAPPVAVLDSASSFALVAGPGLVFARDNRLLFQRLDVSVSAAAGDPVLLAEDVDVIPDTAAAIYRRRERAALPRAE